MIVHRLPFTDFCVHFFPRISVASRVERAPTPAYHPLARPKKKPRDKLISPNCDAPSQLPMYTLPLPPLLFRVLFLIRDESQNGSDRSSTV